MHDVVSDIDRWLSESSDVVTATVVGTWGSAPRAVGAKMAFTKDGKITGSVSGGCVEGAVFENGTNLFKNGPPKLIKFGVSDKNAWDVGLACGGTIEVFIEHLHLSVYEIIHNLLKEEQLFAVSTVVDGPLSLLGKKLIVTDGKKLFGGIKPGLDSTIVAISERALASGKSQKRNIKLNNDHVESLEVFIEVVHPTPTLIVIGGVHIAIALTSIANSLNYRTIILDPRRAFGSHERFEHADQLIQGWPEEALSQVPLTKETAVASLTHDPKIDDPALRIALLSPAFYVGALGSRKTHAARCRRLLDAGLPKEQVESIHGPIGLDINARTPEEIAVSIMAEIIAARG